MSEDKNDDELLNKSDNYEEIQLPWLEWNKSKPTFRII